MAVELATAYVSLVPSFKGSQKAIADELGASPAISNAGRSAGLGWIKGAGKVLGGAALAGIGATAGVALTKGFSRAIQLQDAEAKLTGLGHSAENVAKISDNALGAVRGTAFGMGEAMTAAANAVAAGVKPGADLQRTLSLVGDAATIAGTGMGEMGAIFNKVAASNKVQMDVINQLHDAGVPALALLADQMGVTAEEASKMASAGEIDFATFQAAMEKGLGGAAQASGNTFRGAMANMGAALGRLGAMFATPVVAGMPSVFTAITGAIDGVGTVLKPVAEQFGAWLVPALTATADRIARIGPAITGVAELLKTGDFSSSIREALGVEEDSPVVAGVLRFREIALGVFGEISGGVRAMFAAFRDGGSDVTSGGFAGVLETLGLVARALWDSLGPAIQQLAPQMMTLLQTFSPFGLVLKVIEPVLPQIAAALTAVANAVGGALAAVLPVVVDLVGMLAQTLSGVLVQALPTVVEVITLLAGTLADLLPSLTPIIPLIGNALVTAVKTLLPPLLQVVRAVLPVLAQILGVVVKAATPLIPAVLGIVSALMPLLPVVGQLITALLPPLVSVIQALAPVIQLVANILVAILTPAIKAAGAIIGWLVTNVISPLVGWFATKLGPTIDAFSKAWNTIWAGVKITIAAIWDWMSKWVFAPMKLGIEAVKVAFQLAKDGITTAFNNIKTGLSTVWSWIDTWVFAPFKAGVALIQTAFENVKNGIKAAWEGLKAIAANPVNFVLGTVYNDGIREWWNKIAGAVGLTSLNLPRASLVKFATGGVLPGYTPGRDPHHFYSPTAGHLHLSGGEAIMRPEWTRAVGGPRAVAAMNLAARRGQAAFASGGVFGRRAETGGFPPEWLKAIGNGIASFGKTLWDAGSMAVEIIKDPIGAIKRAVAELVSNAGAGGNSGGMFDIVSELPGKFAGGLAEKVRALLGDQERDGHGKGGTAAGALGVARMTQLVKALVPFARVTSGFRPGAITATGYPSMHGLGRAIDIAGAAPGDAGAMMQIFNALRGAFPNATELIYSPAGARQLYKGRSYVYPEPTRGMHFDHVHWAMANGGVLPKLYDQGGWMPHGGLGLNLSGKPEAVLDPEESAALKNGLNNGKLVENLIVRDEREAIDALERLQRRRAVRSRLGVGR